MILSQVKTKPVPEFQELLPDSLQSGVDTGLAAVIQALPQDFRCPSINVLSDLAAGVHSWCRAVWIIS